MEVVELCYLPWLGRSWGRFRGKWSFLLSQIDWMVPDPLRKTCRSKGKSEVGINLGPVLSVNWNVAQLWLCQSPAVLPSHWAQTGTLAPYHHPLFLTSGLHLTSLTLPYLSLYLLLLIFSNHLWPPRTNVTILSRFSTLPMPLTSSFVAPSLLIRSAGLLWVTGVGGWEGSSVSDHDGGTCSRQPLCVISIGHEGCAHWMEPLPLKEVWKGGKGGCL